jgi:hypothetical protein
MILPLALGKSTSFQNYQLQVKNIDLVDWSNKRLKNTNRVGWLSYKPQPGLSFKSLNIFNVYDIFPIWICPILESSTQKYWSEPIDV